jgi:hypothetical protein
MLISFVFNAQYQRSKNIQLTIKLDKISSAVMDPKNWTVPIESGRQVERGPE